MAEERAPSRLERRVEKARAREGALQEFVDTRYPGMFRVIRIRDRVLVRKVRTTRNAE